MKTTQNELSKALDIACELIVNYHIKLQDAYGESYINEMQKMNKSHLPTLIMSSREGIVYIRENCINKAKLIISKEPD